MEPKKGNLPETDEIWQNENIGGRGRKKLTFCNEIPKNTSFGSPGTKTFIANRVGHTP